MNPKEAVYRHTEHSIRTERLEIRSARPGEGAAIHVLLSAPENNVYMEAESNTTDQTYEDRIKQWQESTAAGKDAFMVITLRDTDTISGTPVGAIIGFGGFNSLPIEPMIESSDGNEPGLLGDIGILIDHRLWHRGLAREATAATIEYAFRELHVGAIWMNSQTRNEPLRRMMESIGLEPMRRIETSRTGGGRSRAFVEGGEDQHVWEFGPKAWSRAKEKCGMMHVLEMSNDALYRN